MQTVLNCHNFKRPLLRAKSCIVTFFIVCGWLFVTADIAIAQDDAGSHQTPLSEQLRSIIDSEGAAAAGSWFKDNWATNKDRYSVDTQAMMVLMSEYLTAGDGGAAQAVGEVTSSIMQDTMEQDMQAHTPEMMDELNAQRQADAKNQAALELNKQYNQSSSDNNANNGNNANDNRGQKREDLERFVGLYGTPNGRQLFVTQSCDGYLVIGTMWGDVTPWWMSPVADSRFNYSDSFMNLAIEFTVANNGQANQLIHDLDGLSSPLSKIGGLPEEFPDCTERGYR